jgi:heme-degrading monooxygenase HmoA
MHAVVGTVTIHDFERGLPALREQLVPRVKQAPGLVNAYWLRSRDNRGMSVIVFETEEAAQALARTIEAEGPPTDAVTINSIEIREVVAQA